MSMEVVGVLRGKVRGGKKGEEKKGGENRIKEKKKVGEEKNGATEGSVI
jgi:hypothetical protein